MTARLCGLGLLATGFVAVLLLHGLVLAGADHPPTPVEMLLSLVAVLSCVGGAATVAMGPALFRPYRWPPAEPHPRKIVE